MDFSDYLSRIEDTILHSLPQEPDKEWKDNSFPSLYEAVTNTHLEPLIEPTLSLVKAGGKRWRPLFLVLTTELILESQERSTPHKADQLQGQLRDQLLPENKKAIIDNAYRLTPLVEFVHTASLIHDDIEDSSTERRGKPAAYITYGLDTALNAGSWLYFQAPVSIDNLNISSTQKNILYRCYSSEVRKLHLGQAMDIAWHRDISFMPTQDQYLAMVKSKTGTLSSMAAKIGSLVCQMEQNLVDELGTIAADIGAGFQIIDDVINLTTGNVGKNRGDDIVEGKKSLPVILLSQNGNQSQINQLQELFAIARKDGIESPAVEQAISILDQSGSIQLAKQIGTDLIHNGIETYIKKINPNYNKSEPLESERKLTELFNNLIPPDFRMEPKGK